MEIQCRERKNGCDGDGERCAHKDPHHEIAFGTGVLLFDTCYDGGFFCPYAKKHVGCESLECLAAQEEPTND